MVKTIGELGITVESGTVLSRIKAKDERDSVTRLVLLPKAVSEGIDLENMETIDVGPGMIDAKRVKTTSSWDVVMKLTSPYEAVSIKPEYQEYVIPSYMAVLRNCDWNVIHPWYLAAVLNSSYVKRYLSSVTSGTSIAMLKIKDILTIPIPVLPVQEQERLGEIYITFVDKRMAMKRLLASEEAMVNVILRDAIKGEV